MRCFIMFPIFTIINLITSLWAPAQSSRGCGCLNPLSVPWAKHAAWLAHRGHYTMLLHEK